MSRKSPKELRKQLFVDPKVQGALILRVILYWAVWAVTISLMLLCWQIITGPVRPFATHIDNMWFHYGPALVASLLLLPIVIVDILRLSNRFTGPMLRLRRCMRQLARGEKVQPIHFRDDDFWQDFADDFNDVLEKVRHRPSDASAQPGQPTESEPEPQQVAEATH